MHRLGLCCFRGSSRAGPVVGGTQLGLTIICPEPGSPIVLRARRRSRYFGIPENRESATSIEAISAAREYIPAFLILAGQQHQSRWYAQPELHRDTVIEVSPTGYTNDQISLQWLHH